MNTSPNNDLIYFMVIIVIIIVYILHLVFQFVSNNVRLWDGGDVPAIVIPTKNDKITHLQMRSQLKEPLLITPKQVVLKEDIERAH